MSICSVPGGKVIYVDNATARYQNMRKTIYNAGEGLHSALGDGYVPWFITLTYRGVDDWEPQHVRDYLKRIRSWLHRKGLKLHYVWVAELQKRGAVHYHLLVWLPRGLRIPHSDRRGWWPHGFTESKPARKRVGYLMKYISKCEGSNKFPPRCRTYGVGGLLDAVKLRVRYWRSPAWFRKLLPSGTNQTNCDLRRVSGGYVDRFTGFFVKSPWQYLTHVTGGAVLFTVDDPLLFKPIDAWLSLPELLKES